MGRGVEHGPLGAGAVSDRRSSRSCIASLTREVPDFPEPGIQFKDLTPLLADAHGLDAVSDALADIARGADLVAGVDARGFLLGGAVAIKLGIGVLAVRKGGKLPPPVFSETYELEYGTATLEVPADGIELAGRNIVDHRRRAGHRRHAGRDGQAAAQRGRERHRCRRGARTGRPRGPRRARTAARQQLAHGLRRYPRSL